LLNRLYTEASQPPEHLKLTANNQDISHYLKDIFNSQGVSLTKIQIDSDLLWIVIETPPKVNVVGMADFMSGPISAPEIDYGAPFDFDEKKPPILLEK